MRPGATRSTGVLAAALLLLLALLLATATEAGVARADGGAPNLVYAAQEGGGLVVIDIAKRQVVGHLAVGGAPSAVLLSYDSRYAYVAQRATGRVAIVNARTQQVDGELPVGANPQAMVLGLPNLLYVANSGSNSVTVLDPDARRTLASIAVGRHPSGLAIAGAGSGITTTDINDTELYVANTDDDSVYVISTKLRRVIATIPAPGGPLGVAIPPAGGVAYVATRSGTVLAVSLSGHRLLGTVFHLSGPAGTMDYDAVTGQVYVPDPTAGKVYVLRPASDAGGSAPFSIPAEPASTLPFAGGPAAVAITFDGAYGFVAERDAGRVVMFDAAAHKTLATVTVGGAPVALVTGAYAPVVDRMAANVIGIALGVAVLLALFGAALVVSLRIRQRRQASVKGPS